MASEREFSISDLPNYVDLIEVAEKISGKLSDRTELIKFGLELLDEETAKRVTRDCGDKNLRDLCLELLEKWQSSRDEPTWDGVLVALRTIKQPEQAKMTIENAKQQSSGTQVRKQPARNVKKQLARKQPTRKQPARNAKKQLTRKQPTRKQPARNAKKQLAKKKLTRKQLARKLPASKQSSRKRPTRKLPIHEEDGPVSKKVKGTAEIDEAARTPISIMDTVPALPDLLIKLEGVADWAAVCPHLLNDTTGETIKEIERNHMDVDGRRTEMLERFLKEPYPIWADVVHALRDGNHNNLADQILKDLLGW